MANLAHPHTHARRVALFLDCCRALAVRWEAKRKERPTGKGGRTSDTFRLAASDPLVTPQTWRALSARMPNLLPLFMLLHSSSALLAAPTVPTRCPQQHTARSPTPLVQLGASSGSTPPVGAAMRLTVRRGPLLRAVILGACALGSSFPALAATAPCVDVDSASAKDLEALKGVAE